MKYPFTFADPLCKWCRGEGVILALDPRYYVICSCRATIDPRPVKEF